MTEFSQVLNRYSLNLENLKIRHSRNLINDDYFQGALDFNFKWLQDAKFSIEDRESVYGKKKEPSEEDKQKYLYIEKASDGSELQYRPWSLIEYRGETIPVYADDPGQQDFTVLRGRVISGGSYNFFPEEVFCYELDRILENEYLADPLTKEENSVRFIDDLMKEDSDGKKE